MEINYTDNLISISISKIEKNICNNFLENYEKLYLNMTGEKTKTLQFIEEENCQVVEYKTLLKFVIKTFSKFVEHHNTFIKNIEFLFRTVSLKKLCKQIFLIYPPQQPYKLISI